MSSTQTQMQAQSQHITLKDYEAVPEDIRAEVFDGEIYCKASPNQVHQEILSVLHITIGNHIYSKDGSCKIFPAPFDVKLLDDPLTIVQPDIMVVCDKDKLDGKRCNGAPDFIIEIVSPGNPNDDYSRKLFYYKTYGVKEYWIVDPITERILVYYFEESKVNLGIYTFNDKIKVNIFQDFYIDFNDITRMLNS